MSVAFIITILYTIIEAVRDGKLLKGGCRWYDHTWSWLSRAIALILISSVTGVHLLKLIAVFYMIFDYAVNVVWGRLFFYMGSTSKTEQYLAWLGVNPLILLIFKITFLCGTLVLL
jgi:hypothetical protein